MAAGPVLDRFETEIAESPFGVVLADRGSRVIDLRFGRRAAMHEMSDSIGLEPGASFTEENTGTNAIATPFETRRPVYVDGDQHYLECLRRFSCCGLPIIHPVTGRLEGVVDIMVDREHTSPLMPSALQNVVDDIVGRLRSMAGHREQVALDAMLAADRTTPVVVLGDAVTLCNRAARDELDAADHDVLEELSDRPDGCHALVLGSGLSVEVRTTTLADDAGTLCTLASPRSRPPVPRGRNARRSPSPISVTDRLRAARSVLVVGEPGSGRTTVAGELGSGVVVRCGDELDEGWIDHLRHEVRPVVLDDVHLLSQRNAGRLARVLDEVPGPVVMTMTDTAVEASGQHAALAARCTERLVVPPLRERGDEFGAVAARIVSDLTLGRARLTLAAVQALRHQPWPGNLRELRNVLEGVAARRPVGEIGPADLPDSHRTVQRRVGLSPLQAAEAETILSTLRLTCGNKAHAAIRLGISRSTLYSRIHAYGIRQ